MLSLTPLFLFFFFNDTATTEIYTLSLHDALPIFHWLEESGWTFVTSGRKKIPPPHIDRKSTRLNSSHLVISYAVFCLKKKKKQRPERYRLQQYKRRVATQTDPVVDTNCLHPRRER